MKHSRTKQLLAVAMCLSLGGILNAQAQCVGGIENPNIESSTPVDQFLESADGTVLHRPTRLVWQRCALGQSWTEQSCSGSAMLMDWAAALQAADSHVQAGQNDWRVPNRNELASIVESRCHSPAINGEVFPATPLEWFWTSSPLSGQAGQAWVVTFADGQVPSALTSGQYAVRLVRGGRN